jgi:hypothetical protein
LVGETVEILNDQELYDHIIKREHLDVFAEFVLENISEWNFYSESFDEFTDRMENEFADLCEIERGI